MDNKVTGDRIKQHIHYDWYKYVVCVVLCVFVFSLAYTWSGNYRAYEELDVFITCYDFMDDDFKSDALKYLNENCDNNIVKVIGLSEMSAISGSWGEALNAMGFNDRTSFLILPESQMDTYASGFLCMYSVASGTHNANAEIWNAVIPDELKDFYALPDNIDECVDKLAKAKTDAELKTVKDEVNAINENLYFDKGGRGIGVYGVRVDNLADITRIRFKSTNPALYPDEKYYLVMHYNNHNSGSYGYTNKITGHYESFAFVKFFLTRYGVPK